MMKTALIFDPLLPPGLCVFIVLIVTLLILYFEIKRRQNLIALRILASALAMLGLLGLLIRPKLPLKIRSTVIVTPGANPETIDSLMLTYPNAESFRIDSAFSDYHLRTIADTTDKVFIVGNGIPLYSVEYLRDVNFQFLAGNKPSGVVALQNALQYSVNMPCKITGAYQGGSNPVWVKLIGPSGAIDSTLTLPDALTPFAFSFRPKQAGKFAYSIEEADTLGNIMTSNTLPVVVREIQPLNILFQLDYPSSEIRFLKNFAAAQGHRLTLRYKVSKDRYRTEIINNAPELRVLNNETLSDFDLVITDQSSLRSLTTSQQASLNTAIDDGLGLLILMNEQPKKVEQQFLDKISFTKTPIDSSSIQINEFITRMPVSPLLSSNAHSVLTDKNKEVVEGFQFKGMGKVGFTTLRDTYILFLKGEENLYGELWSSLITKLARKQFTSFKINAISQFPVYPDDPFNFEVISSGKIPEVKIQQQRIPLAESPFVDDLYNGKCWFFETGWQEISLNDSTKLDIYISKPGEWRSLRTMNQIKAHQLLANNIEKESSSARSAWRQIPPVVFYLFFLVGFGFLWLSPKL